jgi:hypothetical protein
MEKPLGGSIEKPVQPDSLEYVVHFVPSQAEMESKDKWLAPPVAGTISVELINHARPSVSMPTKALA